MNKIITLIGAPEAERFNEYISALNKKIGIQYEKYQQAEKERRLREAKLAQEKREREEKHRHEVEAKKTLIRKEIASLNIELDNLGFALFGQKAHRKAELKALIAAKQSELYSIK